MPAKLHGSVTISKSWVILQKGLSHSVYVSRVRAFFGHFWRFLLRFRRNLTLRLSCSSKFFGKNGNWKDDSLSGLTVALALALVPEAIAFAFIAGVDPLIGLWAAVIQILFGVLKLGRFIRLVPHPVMIGFVNGLAIVILMAIVSVGLLAFLLFKDSPTVSNVLAQAPGNPNEILKGAFPPIARPDAVDWLGYWQFLLKTAFIVAMVGIAESLMTLQLIDEITETRDQGNRECLAQDSECSLRIVWRDGWLRDDRSIADQHQIRWTRENIRNCRGSGARCFHHGWRTRDRDL